MEKLKYILQEWFEFQIPQLIDRRFPENLLNTNLILSIVGVRRSGKTYLGYQMIKKLRREIPISNIIYINFEDDRLYPLIGNELSILLDVYRQNFDFKRDCPIYLFLDEVQNIPGWERTVRRIYDLEKKVKIVITGSSSSLLPAKIATSLRGRTLTFELFPFSFVEVLKANKINFDTRNIALSSKRHRIVKQLNAYIEFGGFPQVVLEENKVEILKGYYRAILYRDIIERYNIKNLRLFEDFLKVVTQNASSLFSYGKTYNLLKSMGLRLSKSTIIEYMEYIKSAFFAFEVPIFSYSIKDQLQYPRKIYLIDTGIRNAVVFRFSEDIGKMAENIVFLALKRKGKEIYYWKDSEGHEVDFVIKEGLKVTQLVQVCWEMDKSKTKSRELKAILKSMEEFNLEKGLVITRDYSGEEKIKNKRIEFIPLWQWLLL